jgi:hypothetical protein
LALPEFWPPLDERRVLEESCQPVGEEDEDAMLYGPRGIWFAVEMPRHGSETASLVRSVGSNGQSWEE